MILASCGSLGPSTNQTLGTRTSSEIQEEIEAELQAMNNISRFDLTLEQFEAAIEKSEFYKTNMKKTAFGYVTKENDIEVVVKSKESVPDEKIPVIYMYVEDKSDFSTIEEKFYEVSTVIFDSLEESLKKEILLPIIQKTANEEQDIFYSENIRINVAFADQEIQLTITPVSD